MNAVTEFSSSPALSAAFVVGGKLVEGEGVRHQSRDLGADFTTPAVDLDALITPRSTLPPMLDVPLAEIVKFLVETGKRLELARNPYLRECLERLAATSPLPRRIVENLYRGAASLLTSEALWSQVEKSFSNPAQLDGWVERVDASGNRSAVRAFPSRMVHMMAGNAPSGCVACIVQGALAKAVNIFKMSSSDPFTCVAVLRTMAEIDPDHPVVRSMSAVYWRGGDEAIERILYRPQYIDKIVAWGGGEAINNVIKYLGPGLQLVSFDPKTSISMIGREAFVSEKTIAEVAELAANDVTVFNQDACLASRFIFVEGERGPIEAFCSKLLERMGVDRDTASALAPPPPADIRAEIEMLQLTGEGVKVWGRPDGRGMVILSEEPVDFHPDHKIANVVMASSLKEAVRHVNVATQTIGVFPPERKVELRDVISSAGGQRICRLGTANRFMLGNPKDGMYPLQRFVNWVADDDVLGGFSIGEIDGNAGGSAT